MGISGNTGVHRPGNLLVDLQSAIKILLRSGKLCMPEHSSACLIQDFSQMIALS